MKFSLTLLLLGLLPYLVQSQQSNDAKLYSHQLQLRHDNDFFALTDRYYSSGLFVAYQRKLERGVFGAKEQLGYKIGQEVYTPSQTQSTNTNVFDRPYAGLSGIWLTWSTSQDKQLLEVESLLGIAGPSSGAGGLQRWYHKAIAISDSPIWTDELEDSFHANLYLTYTKEWKLAPNPFGVRFAVRPKFALGSRDIYTDAEAIFHFGRRNPMENSIAYNRLGSGKKEIYFALRFAYRQVFYNGLIEGNLFGDNSPVLGVPKNSLLRLGFDFNHRFGVHDYRFGIRYNSPETPSSKSHAHIVLAYGRSW
ncbi:lipid A-modifier LpxR family protein [Flagellimonas myxillae]|uniref:lipid A-modifier LpxR family protein n=1 Tax=Flagellimonas myxillae TaxID=2942214 RepID=UPI00201EB7BA|nr:lipid A-modifier LpxR family protein [Muricauda myxillae]MCL6267549.1 lipid A deacylase LpxR family protein [Muricauda myxillae]